jgi:prepilin-type N-terminal cleavage/methylation domain-containing protein
MSRLSPRLPAGRSGMTLLEVLLVVILFGMFAGAVYEVAIVGLRVADAATDRDDVRLQVAKALDLLTREAAAAYNVDNSTSTRFQFDARVEDDDDDGDAENFTNINWRVNNGDLERVQGGTTWTVIPDLTSATFSYLDSAGASTTTANNVRVMQITVTAARGGESITMASTARTRNQ